MSAVPASVYKLVTHSSDPRRVHTLALLKELGRSDTIAYSAGPLGFWSRIACSLFGSTGYQRTDCADRTIRDANLRLRS